eukprot:325880-Chlamydomonas_euryale.AAC.6
MHTATGSAAVAAAAQHAQYARHPALLYAPRSDTPSSSGCRVGRRAGGALGVGSGRSSSIGSSMGIAGVGLVARPQALVCACRRRSAPHRPHRDGRHVAEPLSLPLARGAWPSPQPRGDDGGRPGGAVGGLPRTPSSSHVATNNSSSFSTSSTSPSSPCGRGSSGVAGCSSGCSPVVAAVPWSSAIGAACAGCSWHGTAPLIGANLRQRGRAAHAGSPAGASWLPLRCDARHGGLRHGSGGRGEGSVGGGIGSGRVSLLLTRPRSEAGRGGSGETAVSEAAVAAAAAQQQDAGASTNGGGDGKEHSTTAAKEHAAREPSGPGSHSSNGGTSGPFSSDLLSGPLSSLSTLSMDFGMDDLSGEAGSGSGSEEAGGNLLKSPLSAGAGTPYKAFEVRHEEYVCGDRAEGERG